MLSVIKSDFYKLFRRKSFYICGAVAGLVGIVLVVLINNLYPDAKEYGYNGLNSIGAGLGQVTLLTTIFLSMFIPSEFAYGTVKNMASRGISRVSIYVSKLIMGVFTAVSYTLFTALCGFVSGSIMWGVGEFKSNEFLETLKLFGLFLLAQICLESVFIMVGFLIQHTGGTVATNLGLLFITDILVTPIIDFVVKNWPLFGYTIKSEEYWAGNYVKVFMEVSPEQDIINRGILVCLSYLIISTAIGIFTFCKRDIK